MIKWSRRILAVSHLQKRDPAPSGAENYLIPVATFELGWTSPTRWTCPRLNIHKSGRMWYVSRQNPKTSACSMGFAKVTHGISPGLQGRPWSRCIILPFLPIPTVRIESTSATGTVTVHAEGGINRSPLRGEAPVDLLFFPCLTMVGLCDMVWRCLKDATVSEGKVSVVFWNIHTRNASWVRCWIDRCWMFDGDRMEARIGSGFVSAKFWWCIISSSLDLEWLFSSPRISLSLFFHTPKWRPAVLGKEAETDNFAKANPVDVAELRARINEVVPTKDGSVERQQATCLGSRRLHNMEVS